MICITVELTEFEAELLNEFTDFDFGDIGFSSKEQNALYASLEKLADSIKKSTREQNHGNLDE